jgi:phage tail tape-measure protein
MNEGRSLSEPSDEMEKIIDSGIRINGDINNIKDVMYYVHNNWMGGEISAEEAMKKISTYIR